MGDDVPAGSYLDSRQPRRVRQEQDKAVPAGGAYLGPARLSRPVTRPAETAPGPESGWPRRPIRSTADGWKASARRRLQGRRGRLGEASGLDTKPQRAMGRSCLGPRAQRACRAGSSWLMDDSTQFLPPIRHASGLRCLGSDVDPDSRPNGVPFRAPPPGVPRLAGRGPRGRLMAGCLAGSVHINTGRRCALPGLPCRSRCCSLLSSS